MVIKSPGTNWLATSWLKLLAKRFLTVRFVVAVVVSDLLLGIPRDSFGAVALGGLSDEATIAIRPAPL
jgi:hypothetical protein